MSLGYKPNQYKLIAFILSAALSGLAGDQGHRFSAGNADCVHWAMSGEVVLMTFGGMGTVFGPVVGALIIVALQNYLAPLGAWVTVMQGLIFVICVLTFRRGIVDDGHRKAKLVRQRAK